MTECPASRYFDQGDYAEPESCGLPIEHNADDEPWHVSEWESDGERARLEWRWDQETLVTRWPPPKDALPPAMAHHWAAMLVKKITDANALFSHLPVAAIPEPQGVTAQWRKWGALPAPETAFPGGAGEMTSEPD